MYPKKDVANKDLEASVAEWKEHLEAHLKATGKEAVSADVQRMLLLEICSPALRAHLRMREHLLPDIPAIRQEVADWVYDEVHTHKKADKSFNNVDEPSNTAEQEQKEEECEEKQVWSEELGGWICWLALKKAPNRFPGPG